MLFLSLWITRAVSAPVWCNVISVFANRSRNGSGARGDGGFRPGRGGYQKREKQSIVGSNLRPINWSAERLTTINKNFYHESAASSQRSQVEVDQWFAENEVTVRGQNMPRPILHFIEAGFPTVVTNLLLNMFQKPTTIQSISWPLAMSGRDLVSIAKTGSGKTLAFVLPALVHILGQPAQGRSKEPSVLVLLPTRELAQQVQQVSKPYCNVLGLTLTCLFGGAPKNPQLFDLRKGVNFIVATPGRLMDFLESNSTTLRNCTFLVLDEADRMLDMGFEPQIRKIVSQIRPDRQTLMFSATWPSDVQKLASDFQRNSVHLNVGSLELAANHNIKQIIQVISSSEKNQKLISLLNQMMNEKDCKVLIFVETKRKADDLTRWMRRDGWPALCIHGDKGQSERDWALGEFKNGKVPILLATDVAARGLDVDDVKYVINYDYPNNSEDYVHRIGRTGRREKRGTAYTFFTHENANKARDLIKVLEEAGEVVPNEVLMLANTSYMSSRSRFGVKRAYSSSNIVDGQPFSKLKKASYAGPPRGGGGGGSRFYESW